MNKQAKTIISILLIIIVVLIGLLIYKTNGNKSNTLKNSDSEINKAIGIYHNNNWNSREATLTLNKDMTCNYPSTSDSCKWTISDTTIKITLSGNKENVHEAILTNNGIVLHDHLFTKLN